MDKDHSSAAPELLDEKVIQQHGPWQRVRRWWRGHHPERGVLTWGWTGWETVEEFERIIPLHRFSVAPVPVRAA